MSQVGQLIRKLRHEQKMTVTELADKVGVSPPTITRKEKGDIRIIDPEIEQFANAFDMTLTEFETRLNEHQTSYRAIPILNFSPTGQRLDYTKGYINENAIVIDAGEDNYAHKSNIFALIVCNNAMGPSILEGEYLLFTECNKIDNGEIVYVRFVNGTGAVGRWYDEGDSVRLHFDNSAEPPVMSNKKDISAVYTAIEHRHKPR